LGMDRSTLLKLMSEAEADMVSAANITTIHGHRMEILLFQTPLC